MAYMVKLLKIPPAVINFHPDIRKIPSSGVVEKVTAWPSQSKTPEMVIFVGKMVTNQGMVWGTLW